MLADYLAFWRTHLAWLGRQIAVEEFAERALADETDAGAVFLGEVGQAMLLGDRAHFGLQQFAERKHRMAQLRLVQAMQEVALILAVVSGLEQLKQAAHLAHLGVVTGGDDVRAKLYRV